MFRQDATKKKSVCLKPPATYQMELVENTRLDEIRNMDLLAMAVSMDHPMEVYMDLQMVVENLELRLLWKRKEKLDECKECKES